MGRVRFFNTAGPVDPEMHYCLPPLGRLDLPEVLRLIRNRQYFVLHAPRQTGKTSTLLALRDLLNGGSEGAYRCVYANVEGGQTAREDVEQGVRAVLGALAAEARLTLGDESLEATWPGILRNAGPHQALTEALSRWCGEHPAPAVLLLDEIDALVGDTLLALLRQLRAGYHRRPAAFPQSIVLCGVRDVRDYRIRSTAERTIVTGGSAFNIKAESMRLGDFSAAETEALLALRTAEAGQRWTDEARAEVFRLTEGQPWLVNALAHRACQANADLARPIGAPAIREAREQLILRRETHLDQLTDKLQEERVRGVIGPLLSGDPDGGLRRVPDDDILYACDLGLVRTGPLRIANPIYREVIPRDLTWSTQQFLPHDPAWYVADGELQVEKLLAAFQEFFREHSEHWVERFGYREAGPQLLLQAFLQRVVNAGGRIEREYGLGRRRTDLLIIWPAGRDAPAHAQKTVIECKLLHRSLDRTIEEGLAQTRACMDRCGTARGHLIVFDRTEDRPWAEKLFRRTDTAALPPVVIWGM